MTDEQISDAIHLAIELEEKGQIKVKQKFSVIFQEKLIYF